MINNLFRSKVGKGIMLVMFAYAFMFLLDLTLITYDDVLKSGIHGFGFLDIVLKSLNTAGNILKSVYEFYVNILSKFFSVLRKFLFWFEDTFLKNKGVSSSIYEDIRLLIRGLL